MTPVYWTPEARTRLKDIQDYLINQHATKAANKVIVTLLSRTRQLEEPYRIIYRVTEQQIEILTVMHYRQLLPTTVM